MRILGIDTSAGAASVALCDEKQLLGEFFINTKLTHSETLMPMVKALLDDTRLTLGELDALAVSSGPGSFTGLRIGIAAVKGMAFARQLPCAGVSTLEALAYNLRGFEGVVCAAMDARCDQFYTALFVAKGGAVSRLSEDSALTAQEVADRLHEINGPIFLVGDGASLCYNSYKKIKADEGRVFLAPEHLLFQRASSVCALARGILSQGGAQSADALVPTYLRLPQAERERLAREGNTGTAQSASPAAP